MGGYSRKEAAMRQAEGKNPVPTLRRLHIAWLFIRGGLSWKSVLAHMEELNMDAHHLRKMLYTNPNWAPAVKASDQKEYERRAFYCLELEKIGAYTAEIPSAEIALMGNIAIAVANANRAIIHGDGSETEAGQIMGMPMPDLRRTVQEIVAGGLGHEQNIPRIRVMIEAELLCVPKHPGGFTFVPVSDNMTRLKRGERFTRIHPMSMQQEECEAPEDGVLFMGNFFDKSSIVPDQKTRNQGFRLAKDILGITDEAQIRNIINTMKAQVMELQVENISERNIQAFRKEALAAAAVEGSVEGAGGKKGGITMVRPKMLSPEEFNAQHGRGKPDEEQEQV